MAQHLGLQSLVTWINRAEAGVDLMKVTLWNGMTVYQSKEIDRLSQKRRMMLGVAGVVAERAWTAARDDYSPEWESQLLEMSPTDWRMAGLSPGNMTQKLYRVADEVLVLLQHEGGILWRPLLAVARALMRNRIYEIREGLRFNTEWKPDMEPNVHQGFVSPCVEQPG